MKGLITIENEKKEIENILKKLKNNKYKFVGWDYSNCEWVFKYKGTTFPKESICIRCNSYEITGIRTIIKENNYGFQYQSIKWENIELFKRFCEIADIHNNSIFTFLVEQKADKKFQDESERAYNFEMGESVCEIKDGALCCSAPNFKELREKTFYQKKEENK